MRYLGVDFGERRIGLAVSDPGGTMAFPHSTVTAVGAKEQVAQVVRIAREIGADEVVVGCPVPLSGRSLSGRPLSGRGLSGQAGPAEKKVQRFAGRLSSERLRVVLWDERFTTVGARSALQEQQVDARGQRAVIDQVAATLILQSYLDHVNRAKPGQPSGPIQEGDPS